MRDTNWNPKSPLCSRRTFFKQYQLYILQMIKSWGNNGWRHRHNKKLVGVQSKLNYTKSLLQQKENEHLEKYKNNVESLKKYIEDKRILQDNLVNCRKKVKELGKKLKLAHTVDFEEPEASRQGNRECSNCSCLE